MIDPVAMRAVICQVSADCRAHLVHRAPLRPASSYRRNFFRPHQRNGGTRLDKVGRVPGV
jgi:hypothetical protein